MAITAAQVKELRERTGSGMMECKKALTEANGDIELAIENMRKAGQAKAAKRAGRIAAEGAILVRHCDEGNTVVMVDINCETDFVARGDDFQSFAATVADRALAERVNSLDALVGVMLDKDGDQTIEQARQALIAKIGENIQIRRIALLESPAWVESYLHGERIGVIVAGQGGEASLAKDIAMHVAASNPSVVAPQDVPAEKIEKEKEIFAAQAKKSGKPDEIIEKIISGRVSKFLEEVSLQGQPFVKDPNKSVGDLLKSQAAEVSAFVRFEVGEGIDKTDEEE